MNKGIRLQIVCYEKLIAEVIVETSAEANKLWSKYACEKYRKGLPLGAAIQQRADLPRAINVRVGECVNC